MSSSALCAFFLVLFIGSSVLYFISRKDVKNVFGVAAIIFVVIAMGILYYQNKTNRVAGEKSELHGTVFDPTYQINRRDTLIEFGSFGRFGNKEIIPIKISAYANPKWIIPHPAPQFGYSLSTSSMLNVSSRTIYALESRMGGKQLFMVHINPASDINRQEWEKLPKLPY